MGKAAAATSKVTRWITLSLFMAAMLDAALPLTGSGIAPSFNISVSTGNNSTSSTTRRGTTPTTPSTTAQTSFPPLPPSPISSASPIGGTQQGISNTYSVLILATILPIAGIVLVIVIIACVVVRQRKRSRRQGRMNHQFQPTGSVSKHGIHDPTFNPHFLRTESVKSDDYYLPVTAEDGLVLHPGASPSHSSRNGPLPRPPVEVPTQHMVGDEYSYAYNKGFTQNTLPSSSQLTQSNTVDQSDHTNTLVDADGYYGSISTQSESPCPVEPTSPTSSAADGYIGPDAVSIGADGVMSQRDMIELDTFSKDMNSSELLESSDMVGYFGPDIVDTCENRDLTVAVHSGNMAAVHCGNSNTNKTPLTNEPLTDVPPNAIKQDKIKNKFNRNNKMNEHVDMTSSQYVDIY